jgi:acyl-CoA synthetase (AMP-forming)/AMP-acid ligase II
MRHPDDPACHFVVGRKKEMIVSGAENIYPAEVELAIQKHPGVDSVVVFGIPDEKWGETVKAAVILKPDAKATGQEIIAFCRQHIAGYKKPTSVYFVKEFPRNTFGKILKNDLARMAIEGKLQT